MNPYTRGTNALPNPQGNLNMQQMEQTEKSIVDSNLWLPKYMSGVQNLKPQDSAFILAHINDITPTDVHMHACMHAHTHTVCRFFSWLSFNP